jgi:hypothetical protein
MRDDDMGGLWQALKHLLPRYPGVGSDQVAVDHGVVTLEEGSLGLSSFSFAMKR